MEADVAVAQGVIFEAEALEVDSLAGDYILVIGFRVGQLGFVEVVTCLGEHNPFLPDIDADAIDGGDVLTEELFLLEGSSIDDVEIHLHAFELQLVAQSNVVDELAGLIFNHVDGIGRLEDAIVAVPHQIVGVDALHGLVDEWRVAHLDEEVVLTGIVLEIQGGAYLVAAYGVPELGAIVDVNGVGIIFPAANGDDLLAS